MNTLNILYCAYNEGINAISKNILPPRSGVKHFISHQVHCSNSISIPESLSGRKDVIIESITGRGLSINRNSVCQLALRYNSVGYFLIADEDVIYDSNVYELVLNAFNTIPIADLLTFKIKTLPGQLEYKRYRSKTFKHNIFSASNVSSIEIAGRIEVLSQAKFDENFGLGTVYPSGEEAMFIIDLIRAGNKAFYYPEYIVNHPFESSAKRKLKNFTEQDIKLIGAKFYRMYREPLSSIFFIYTTIKNFYNYKSKFNMFEFYRLLNQGKNDFKQL